MLNKEVQPPTLKLKNSKLYRSIKTIGIIQDTRPTLNKGKPKVQQLSKIYSKVELGQPLSNMDLEFIAGEAKEALDFRRGELTYQPLLLAMLDAFAMIWGEIQTKATPQREDFDRFYKGNLITKRSTLEESIAASRQSIQAPSFAGRSELAARNLVFAARMEPLLELEKLPADFNPILKTIMQGAIRNHCIKSQTVFQPVPTEEPDSAEYFEKHSKTASLVSGNSRLDVSWDHSTAGGELTLNLDSQTSIIRCDNFVILMDLMILLDNISMGGPGGTRGPFTLEVMLPRSGPNGAAFQFRNQGTQISFMLKESDLDALSDISKRFWNPSGVCQKMQHLAWLYGMG